MKLTFITIFPDLVENFFAEGLLAKARRTGKIKVATVNPRDFATDKHGTVDDAPYGGGAGLVMKIEPLVKAIKSVGRKNKQRRIILMDARGKRFTQKEAKRLAKYAELVFISGRYEGVDERVKHYIDEQISLGEFVLMGGEVAALTITEAVVRLLPGVLGNEESSQAESFSVGSNLEHSHYTRPEVFDGHKVPKVLLSGDHQAIEQWRRKNSS